MLKCVVIVPDLAARRHMQPAVAWLRSRLSSKKVAKETESKEPKKVAMQVVQSRLVPQWLLGQVVYGTSGSWQRGASFEGSSGKVL